MLFRLRAEAQPVNGLDDLPQVVAAVDLVLGLAENFSDFVFDGVWSGGPLLEAFEIGAELEIDEVAKVVADESGVVVKLAILALVRSPARPAVGLVEDVAVFPAVERGLGGFVIFEAVEVFQEEQLRGLLGVFQDAATFPAEDVVNVAEGLFKHGRSVGGGGGSAVGLVVTGGARRRKGGKGFAGRTGAGRESVGSHCCFLPAPVLSPRRFPPDLQAAVEAAEIHDLPGLEPERGLGAFHAKGIGEDEPAAGLE